METGLSDLIPGALPATMKQLAERLCVENGPALWDAVKKLRQSGVIRRIPGLGGGDRVFYLSSSQPPKLEPAPDRPGQVADDTNDTEEDRKRKAQHVILVSLRGWPLSQPGRPMVFDVRRSAPKAYRTVQRLREQFADPDLDWWIEPLTQARIRDLQDRVSSKTLREVMARRNS